MAKNDKSSVYCTVSEPSSPPAQDLYVIDFERCPGDLGVSLIIRGTSFQSAKLEAWRLFPEYKRLVTRTCVRLLDFAEIDWQSGQSFLVTRKVRPAIPVFKFDEQGKLRNVSKREEGAQ